MEDGVFYRKTEPKGGVRPLSSVLKTLALVDVMARHGRPARLADIARAANMSRGTAHQKLVTLLQAGWIEQVEGLYRLSLHATQIASAALEHADLGERVVPFLEDLVVKAKETASLAVIDGVSICIVQRVESTGVLRADLHVGALLDLQHSASGRVLAAFARERMLDEWRRRKVPLADAKVLEQVRREKFAVSSGMSYEGVRAIGAPVFDSRGECAAALTLVGPVPRFDVNRLRPLVEKAAARMSDHMRTGVQ
jgi:DNA-binding IclR family transcriptional regulator